MTDNITVATYLHHDPDYQQIADSIVAFIAVQHQDDKLFVNYSNRLELSQSVAITICKDNTGIVGFSTVLWRDLFGNSVRVLNRFFKDKKIRNHKTPMSYLTDATMRMVEQQLDAARKLGYDFAFMSRESSTPYNAFQHYTSKLPQDWQYYEHRHKVCNGNPYDCYQFISICALNDAPIDVARYPMLQDSVSEEEYQKWQL
jgi:hypothetical protein